MKNYVSKIVLVAMLWKGRKFTGAYKLTKNCVNCLVWSCCVSKADAYTKSAFS
jgi:hypothetical protein